MPAHRNNKKNRKTFENLNLKTCNLKDIDQVLEDLTKADQHNNWARYFRLFAAVRDRELFREGGFPSFTSWLGDFCSKHSISEQRAWAFKRAGETYELYRKVDPEAPMLEDVNIAPDTLNYVDKAAIKRFGGTDEGEAERNAFISKHVKKAVQGQLTRDGAKQIYTDARKAAEKAKRALTDGKTEEEAGEVRRNTEKADSLKREIQENWHWLGEKQEIKTNYNHSSSVRDFYVAVPEFSFSTPGEEQAQIATDELVLENLSTPKGYELYIHSIEIKVDSYDFRRDRKWIDFKNWSDFLWLCTPEEVLMELEPAEIPSDAGIIAYREDNAIHGIIREENGKFVRDNLGSVEYEGKDQLMVGAVPEELGNRKLYVVRPAEKNLDEEKRTEQTLRWWALRRR